MDCEIFAWSLPGILRRSPDRLTIEQETRDAPLPLGSDDAGQSMDVKYLQQYVSLFVFMVLEAVHKCRHNSLHQHILILRLLFLNDKLNNLNKFKQMRSGWAAARGWPGRRPPPSWTEISVSGCGGAVTNWTEHLWKKIFLLIPRREFIFFT